MVFVDALLDSRGFVGVAARRLSVFGIFLLVFLHLEVFFMVFKFITSACAPLSLTIKRRVPLQAVRLS